MNPVVDRIEPSTDVRVAWEFVRENADALTVLALPILAHSEQLPSDDFFVAQTIDLGNVLAVTLDDWPEEDYSLRPAFQIFPFGPRRLVIPWAATLAGGLYLAGHRSIGIGLVNAHGRGRLFRYTGFDDVQSREIVGTLNNGAVQ